MDTSETIFQRYNRDEILAGMQSTDWANSTQDFNNLIDHNPNTKWGAYFSGNKLSVTI